MLNTNPVRIRKIYTNRRRGRSIACFTGNGNNLVAHTHNTFFLVIIHDGTIILEPLHIICNDSHSSTRIKVFDLNNSFIRTAVTHRVIVYFHEAIDVIYITACSFDPSNIVVVPFREIPCFVVFNQKFQCRRLVSIFCDIFCLL